ncbi:sodium-dependent transporter [Halorubrum gandharaense]
MEQWSSRLGFVFAAIGAAVGLGNVWRFPAVVGQNGGGAYLVPYLIAVVSFALPLLIFEISTGRSLRADVVSAFRSVRPAFAAFGWLVTAVVVVVLSYYLVITGWVLAFLVDAATGGGLTFAGFTATLQPVVTFVVAALLVGLVVSFGVQDGIERLTTVLIPLAFVILGAMALWATQLDGFREGLAFFVTPDVSVLSDPLIWSAAFGQVFFSFSVGMGVMLTYGSYLDGEANVAKSATVIAAADLAVALLAGVVIFAVVFTFGLTPTAGSELAFATLPEAFAQMPFGGVFGLLFFGLLFFAAIAPSVSMLEVGVASVTRTTNLSRRAATVVATGGIILLGLPSALSYSAVDLTLAGVPVLDLLDGSVGAFGLPVAALLVAVGFTWYRDSAALRAEFGSSPVLPLVKYVIPPMLGVVTAYRFATDPLVTAWRRLPDGAPLEAVTVIVVLAVLTAFAIGGWWLRRRTA